MNDQKFIKHLVACLTGIMAAAFWQPQHIQAQTWNEVIKTVASDRSDS